MNVLKGTKTIALKHFVLIFTFQLFLANAYLWSIIDSCTLKKICQKLFRHIKADRGKPWYLFWTHIFPSLHIKQLNQYPHT